VECSLEGRKFSDTFLYESFINTYMRLSNIITDLYEQANPSDEEFWRIVSKVDWNLDHNYDRIKYQLMRTVSPAQAEGLRRKFDKFYKKLDYVLSGHVEGVGDDGYNDLLSHIIGSGKKTYDAVINEPDLAQTIVDNNEYVESFAYVFPDSRATTETGYKDIDPDNMKAQAEKYLGMLQPLVGQHSPVESKESAQLILSMIKRLRAAADGNFEKAAKGWDRESYSKWGSLTNMRGDSGGRIHDLNFGPSNFLNDLVNFTKH